MISNSKHCGLLGSALVALAGFASSPVVAAATDRAAVDRTADTRPAVIAQAARPDAASPPRVIAPGATFPAYQRGVKEAAATSNEALRRYVWRTRMIYNFYYRDFASGE